MDDLKALRDAKCGASLEDGILTLECGWTYPIAAMVDLISSVEADTSTDGGESYTVIGNVDTPTLVALGMRKPEPPKPPPPFDTRPQRTLGAACGVLLSLGFEATYEYPGYIRIPIDDAHDLHVGDVNGYFSAEVFDHVTQLYDEAISLRLPLTAGPELLTEAIKVLLEDLQ
jgi:hypothetical protein